MNRLVELITITSLVVASIPASAAPTATSQSQSSKIAEMNDLANDWTYLSPRRYCLGHVGLKEKFNNTMERDDNISVQVLRNAADRTNIQYVTDRYLRSGKSVGYFSKTIGILIDYAAYNALDRNINVQKLVRILDALSSLPSPVIAPPPPRTYSTDKRDAAEATINRLCVLEFFAAAYGIGESSVDNRYQQAVEIWRTALESENIDNYPRALTSLNYMTTREHLLHNDQVGAFRLSTDPVMDFALSHLEYVAHWKAGFYRFGIGTPINVPAAIKVYDSGVAETDPIQSALLRASIGQKVAAAAQLRNWMTKEWRSEVKMTEANRAYQAITGTQFQKTGQESNVLTAIIAIPLAIVAYCLTNRANCPSSNRSANASSYDDSQQRLNRDIEDRQDRMQFLQNLQEAQTWKF